MELFNRNYMNAIKNFLPILVIELLLVVINLFSKRQEFLYGRECEVWGFPFKSYFKYELRDGVIEGWLKEGLLYNLAIGIFLILLWIVSVFLIKYFHSKGNLSQ